MYDKVHLVCKRFGRQIMVSFTILSTLSTGRSWKVIIFNTKHNRYTLYNKDQPTCIIT